VVARRKRKSRFLSSHQRSWLWGHNLVSETLAAGRWPILELVFAEDLALAVLDPLVGQAKALGLRPTLVPRLRLEELVRVRDHQGCIARVGPYPYVAWADLLARAREPGALYVVLDGIQDPFNLGAVLRSAEVFGAGGVVLADSGQTGINSQVARSSAGAVNRLAIAEVASIRDALTALAGSGVRAIGTAADAGQALDEEVFTGPVALVIGGEGRGLSPEVRDACQALVRVPQRGGLNSLNAAAAAAVCLYEIDRQRRRST